MRRAELIHDDAFVHPPTFPLHPLAWDIHLSLATRWKLTVSIKDSRIIVSFDLKCSPEKPNYDLPLSREGVQIVAFPLLCFCVSLPQTLQMLIVGLQGIGKLVRVGGVEVVL